MNNDRQHHLRDQEHDLSVSDTTATHTLNVDDNARSTSSNIAQQPVQTGGATTQSTNTRQSTLSRADHMIIKIVGGLFIVNGICSILGSDILSFDVITILTALLIGGGLIYIGAKLILHSSTAYALAFILIILGLGGLLLLIPALLTAPWILLWAIGGAPNIFYAIATVTFPIMVAAGSLLLKRSIRTYFKFQL